ncbi:hypothetical protein [[Eubacterium] cellulosolvens]
MWMNLKKIFFPILGGVGITLLTGLFSNMTLMLVGASHFGYPLAWLVRLILAPEYFPWRVNVVNLIVDVAFWSAIIGFIWFLVDMRGRKKMVAVISVLLVLFASTFSAGMFYYQSDRDGRRDASS